MHICFSKFFLFRKIDYVRYFVSIISMKTIKPKMIIPVISSLNFKERDFRQKLVIFGTGGEHKES
jgi:hypothetical protein